MNDSEESSFQERKQKVLAEVDDLQRKMDAEYYAILELPLTDVGNAERLIRFSEKKLAFLAPERTWLFWNGKIWERDDRERIVNQAINTLRFTQMKASYDCYERVKKFASRSESKNSITNMITLAQNKVAVTLNELDRDPWALNLQNGTLDLRTMDLKPHNQADYITRVCPASFDPKATCPTWHAFINRIMGGCEDLIDFIQRAVGYSLTGETFEQVVFLMYGTGANGKSTFIETMRKVMGDYARNADYSSFLDSRSDGIRNDLARLAGARLVSASEVRAGRSLDEAVLKKASGGDAITARFLHREYFEYHPTFKLWLSANHKPQIKGTDHGIWRRIRLLPFKITIPESDQDKQLGQKLEAENSGILNWCLEGVTKWQENGLGAPTEVQEETSQYRAEQDAVGRFLDECCELGEEHETASTEIYRAYQSWCEGNGERAISKNWLGMAFKERGLEPGRTKHQRGWKGVRLADAGTPPAALRVIERGDG